MTDTTHEAPERIWLTNFVKDGYGARLGRGTISDLDHSPNPDYPEYVRIDLVEAAEQQGYASAMEAERKLHEARITDLEAKLEKAVEFAEVVERCGHGALWDLARTTLAELKGQDDE